MEGFVAGRGRVLDQHRCEIADAGIASEAGEKGHAGVPPASGLRDNDGAAADADQPVPLAGVVALDAVGLVLANIE
jgi:hypothetical protein